MRIWRFGLNGIDQKLDRWDFSKAMIQLTTVDRRLQRLKQEQYLFLLRYHCPMADAI